MKGIFLNVIEGDGVAKILLYGDVGDGQRVDSARVVAELMSITGRFEKVAVHINSKGGDVFSGIAIYNALKNSPANITIFIDGVAASIAAVIALCGKPLFMSRHAKLMLHAVSGGAYGNSGELRRIADVIDELQDELGNMIASRCKMSANEVVDTYFDGKDHWISAQEALEMSLIDGFYDTEAVPPSDSTEDIYNFINHYKLNNMALLDDIKKMPAFAGKSDEEIVACVKDNANSATLVDSLKKANEQYKARIADLESKEVTVILDQAVADGKITQEQKATYAKLMNSDRENTEALLASMPKKQVRIDDYISTGVAINNLANKTWDELDKSGKLAELKACNAQLFAQKYEEKFGVPYKE